MFAGVVVRSCCGWSARSLCNQDRQGGEELDSSCRGGGIDRRGERLVGCDRENSQSFERSEIPAMLNKGR